MRIVKRVPIAKCLASATPSYHQGNTMKIRSGRLAETSATPVPYSAMSISHTQLEVLKTVFVAVAFASAILYGLFRLPLTFDDSLVQMALDVLSWCLVGALATFLLMLAVKVIDGLLDV